MIAADHFIVYLSLETTFSYYCMVKIQLFLLLFCELMHLLRLWEEKMFENVQGGAQLYVIILNNVLVCKIRLSCNKK